MGLIPERKPRNESDRRHGNRRREDRRADWIDRGWLALLTLLWVFIAISLSHANARQDQARIQVLKDRCEFTQHTVDYLDAAGAPPGEFQKDLDKCYATLHQLEEETK